MAKRGPKNTTITTLSDYKFVCVEFLYVRFILIIVEIIVCRDEHFCHCSGPFPLRRGSSFWVGGSAFSAIYVFFLESISLTLLGSNWKRGTCHNAELRSATARINGKEVAHAKPKL